MSSSVASIAQWQRQVATLLPGLSKPEANVLGLLSYAVILTRGSGLTRLSRLSGGRLEQVPAGRLRQRLRDWYYEAKAKRGAKRREIQVETCFPDLLRGLLKQWNGPKEVVLALDASALSRTVCDPQSERDVSGMRHRGGLEDLASERAKRGGRSIGCACCTWSVR
jgi:hypothetical protein